MPSLNESSRGLGRVWSGAAMLGKAPARLHEVRSDKGIEIVLRCDDCGMAPSTVIRMHSILRLSSATSAI